MAMQRFVELVRVRAKEDEGVVVAVPRLGKYDLDCAEANFQLIDGILEMLEQGHSLPHYSNLCWVVLTADAEHGIGKLPRVTSSSVHALWARQEARQHIRLLAFVKRSFVRWPKGAKSDKLRDLRASALPRGH